MSHQYQSTVQGTLYSTRVSFVQSTYPPHHVKTRGNVPGAANYFDGGVEEATVKVRAGVCICIAVWMCVVVRTDSRDGRGTFSQHIAPRGSHVRCGKDMVV